MMVSGQEKPGKSRDSMESPSQQKRVGELTHRTSDFGSQALPLLHIFAALCLEPIHDRTVFRGAALPVVQLPRLKDLGIIITKFRDLGRHHISEVRVLFPFDSSLGDAFYDG